LEKRITVLDSILESFVSIYLFTYFESESSDVAPDFRRDRELVVWRRVQRKNGFDTTFVINQRMFRLHLLKHLCNFEVSIEVSGVEF
jgi:hypothetical protein